MVLASPRRWVRTYGTLVFATSSAMPGSMLRPEMSLMTAAPAFSAASAVETWVVSMLTSAPAFTRAAMTGTTRRCSSAGLTSSAPGRVDSPPTSMMSAPA